MPIYEAFCTTHGLFEKFRPMEDSALSFFCPKCNRVAERIFSVPHVMIDSSPRLQYGSGSPGRMIPSSVTGGVPIYIPSDGALEQDEVDYIAVGAIENEKARVRKKQGRRNKELVSAYANLARSAPKGQRVKTLRAAMEANK